MDQYDDITSGDIRELAALISGYTDDEHVTDEEASAVLAWCREWVADCGFDNVEDVSTLPDAVLLAGCNRHVVGGLAFVLADVRLCATPANRELAEWGTLADSAASLAARRCELAREGDPEAFAPIGASAEHVAREVYEVRDRNARDSRDVLAGPFLTRELAEEERARWCAPVDAYIVPCTVDAERYARIVAHEEDAVRELSEGAVSVSGFPAVALRVVGSAGSGMVRVVMVGDDHEHVVPLEDVTPLDDLAYCAECGQLGCEHDGRERDALKCPECGEEVWDVPNGSKLAKCWNTEGHSDGGTLAFDTMDDDETDYDVPEVVYVACSCCGHVVTADAERMPRDCENCYAASLRTFAELDDAEAYSEHVLGDGRV